ncbi:MAG: outer membrane protein, partial [Phenylobacterium sp.]|nr:outer membrane protein [Phenylobacterium sp.]
MQRTRANGAALASGLALLMGSTALTLPGSALAQDAAPAQAPLPVPAPEAPAAAQAQGQQSGVVQRIIVRGIERIEQSTVLSYLPIQQGEVLDPAKADLALKTLFRTDLFADVKIDL